MFQGGGADWAPLDPGPQPARSGPRRSAAPAAARPAARTATVRQKEGYHRGRHDLAHSAPAPWDATAAAEGRPLKDLSRPRPAETTRSGWTPQPVTATGMARHYRQRPRARHRMIHLRGLHYMVIGRARSRMAATYRTPKRTGLAGRRRPRKAARWLGYIPFDQIIDQRNAAPVVRIFKRAGAVAVHPRRLDVDIPDADDITPRVRLEDFAACSPTSWCSSARSRRSRRARARSPTATRRPVPADRRNRRHDASTDGQGGAEDGRPMVVFNFSDCRPGRLADADLVARKLQAFKDALFPDLEFQVHRVALTPEQVREYGLPSTPLKDTEKRGDALADAMGVEQTEIDALATLRPDLLRQIARDAIGPFYDPRSSNGSPQAREAWRSEHRPSSTPRDADPLERLRDQADRSWPSARGDRGDQRRAPVDAERLRPSHPVVPTPRSKARDRLPLIDSGWSFAEQCRRLIDSKGYRNGKEA